MLVPALVTVGATLVAKAAADAQRAKRSRAGLLASCRSVLAEAEESIAADGYPRLGGYLGDRRYELGLIADTLELRRLPQLWLTIAATSHGRLPCLAVTMRPRGDDFVSAAFAYPRQVDVPAWLPPDAMVRGTCRRRTALALETLREPLAALFADPMVKEITMSARGYRILYRLAEGERASHLLLRRSRFDARFDADLLERLDDACRALDVACAPSAIAA